MTMYTPLHPSPPESVSFDDVLPSRQQPKRPNCYTLIACLFCTILNIYLTFGIKAYSRKPTFSYKDTHRLRRPSQFIRFDEIARPSTPMPKRFDNHPYMVIQVDSTQPHKVVQPDVMSFMALIGTVVPTDKHLIVNNSMSTIVQFRAVDYGMEICELRFAAPVGALESAVRPGAHLELSIYRLDDSLPIDTQTLSHSTRPKRLSLLSEMEIRHGKSLHWAQNFSCSMEEVLTFELACSSSSSSKGGDGCQFEWWQNAKTKDHGFYITQYSTI